MRQGVSLVDRVNLFFHYRRYIKMVARRWFILVLTVVGFGGHAVYKAITTPDKYRATAQISVKPRVQTGFEIKTKIEEEMNYFFVTQLRFLNGRDVAKRVEARLREQGNLLSFPPTSAYAKREAGTFVLTVDSENLEFARKYARIWPAEFLAFRTTIKSNQIGSNVIQTRNRIDSQQQALDELRAKIQAFQRSNNVANIKEAGLAAEERLQGLKNKLQSIQTQRKILQGKSGEEIATSGLKELRGNDSQPKASEKPAESALTVDPLSKYSDNSYAEFKFNLAKALAEKKNLEETLLPMHPAMKAVTKQIRELEGAITVQIDLIENKRKAQIDALIKEEQSMEPIIEDVRKEVMNSAHVRDEYTSLKEEETRILNSLENLFKEKQTYDADTGQDEQFSVFEAGEGSSRPFEPDRPRIVMMGLLFGFAVGFGIIYFLDRLDDRLELAEEIEAKLKHPVLGQIPQAVPPEGSDCLLLTKLDEHNVFSESVRGVRSAVLLGSQGNQNTVLLVTSAVPGDGKTTFTTNFAITLAIAGHRVLLVDADMRRGNTHSFFSNKRDPGFSEVLQGELHWTDVLRQTDTETLKVIHSGKLPANPGELLIGPVTKQFVEEVKQEFDYIIFDCPPLTAIDDTFSLITMANGVLFVVRSGQTSMRFARNALTSLVQRGAKVLGLVVNGITADNPYYYYQHYYHGYYTRAQQQEAPPLSSAPMPASKMASPKRTRRVRSIEAEAQVQAKSQSDPSDITAPSPEALAAVERAKAEQFRTKRWVKRSESSSETPNQS